MHTDPLPYAHARALSHVQIIVEKHSQFIGRRAITCSCALSRRIFTFYDVIHHLLIQYEKAWGYLASCRSRVTGYCWSNRGQSLSSTANLHSFYRRWARSSIWGKTRLVSVTFTRVYVCISLCYVQCSNLPHYTYIPSKDVLLHTLFWKSWRKGLSNL